MFSYGTTVSPRVRIHSQMFINLWKGWKPDDFWDGGFWSEVFMFFSHFYKVATKLDWTKLLMRNHVNNVLSFFLQKILSGSLQSLLASSREPELLLKAKSDVSLACTTSQSISMDLSSGGLIHAADDSCHGR